MSKKLKSDVGEVFPTAHYGDVMIIAREGVNNLTVKFLRTGHIKTNVAYRNLWRGTVADTDALPEGVTLAGRKRKFTWPKRNYVYIARHGGVVVYIGYGTKGRYRHCTNGKSGCYLLNKLHFSGEAVEVEIAVDDLNLETAKILERQLIQYYNPQGNRLLYKNNKNVQSSA